MRVTEALKTITHRGCIASDLKDIYRCLRFAASYQRYRTRPLPWVHAITAKHMEISTCPFFVKFEHLYELFYLLKGPKKPKNPFEAVCLLQAADDAVAAKWFPVTQLPALAFDHQLVVRECLAKACDIPEASSMLEALQKGIKLLAVDWRNRDTASV